MLFSLLVGAAGLHPSMRALYVPVTERRDRLPWPYLGLLITAALTAPALLAVEAAGGPSAGRVLVGAAAAALLVLLVMARMFGLVRAESLLVHRLAEQNTKLREAEERFRTVFEAAPLGIAVCALDGRLVQVNQKRAEMLGYGTNELEGMRFSDFSHEGEVAEAVRLFGELARGERDSYVLEKRDVRKDGSVMWVSLSVSLIRGSDGRPSFALAMTADITERKELETERERLLAQEQAQVERLRELDRMKDDFVASVSHELRTPLTSIRGYLELVLDGGAGEVTDEQRHFLGIVNRNSDRLLALVSDLLLVAQAEKGDLGLRLTNVDLSELAGHSFEALKPRAAELELSLSADPAAVVRGDERHLAQAIDNLLSNAVKFTPPGGRIDVRVWSQNGSAVLEVADTGAGISSADQERLFERFFRTTTAERRAVAGTGLGLAITRAIVEAHDGRIEVESEVGQGAAFRIELPLVSSVAAPAPALAGREQH